MQLLEIPELPEAPGPLFVEKNPEGSNHWPYRIRLSLDGEEHYRLVENLYDATLAHAVRYLVKDYNYNQRVALVDSDVVALAPKGLI